MNMQILQQDIDMNNKNMTMVEKQRFLMKSELREQQKKEFVKQLCHMETLENVHNTLKEDFVKSSSLVKQRLSEAN